MAVSGDPRTESRRRGCATVIAVTAVLALLCGVGAGYIGASLLANDDRQIGPDVAFTSAAWREATEQSNVRLTMLRDLVGRVGLIGRSRAELEQLLGPPTHELWSDAYPHPGYALGLGRNEWFDGAGTTPLVLVYDDQSSCVGYWAYYDAEIAVGASARAAGR